MNLEANTESGAKMDGIGFASKKTHLKSPTVSPANYEPEYVAIAAMTGNTGFANKKTEFKSPRASPANYEPEYVTIAGVTGNTEFARKMTRPKSTKSPTFLDYKANHAVYTLKAPRARKKKYKAPEGLTLKDREEAATLALDHWRPKSIANGVEEYLTASGSMKKHIGVHIAATVLERYQGL